MSAPVPLPDRRRCPEEGHIGPLLNQERYNEFALQTLDNGGGMWFGFGECEHCGSTIHKNSLLRRAA